MISMINWMINNKKKTKTNYKCSICHRKPDSDFVGYKGWICLNCLETRQDDINEHNEKLLEKRKYKEVEYQFKSIDELMEETFIYWWGKLYHIAVIRNWSYNMIENNLCKFNKAILKESVKVD